MAFTYDILSLSIAETPLLTLIPASEKTNDIHCKLETVPLSQLAGQKYEALSYAWGDPTKSHEIFVNGKVLKITTNLHVALQYLRQPDVARVLWIDAICIDQENISEKNHQVK